MCSRKIQKQQFSIRIQPCVQTNSNFRNSKTEFKFNICTFNFEFINKAKTLIFEEKNQLNIAYNKFMSREIEMLDNANIKGLTIYQMIVCYGCPSDANNNAVTTTNCKIDYVTKKQNTYKW